MSPLAAPVLATQSVTRQRVFGALLAEPGRDWTVGGMAALLPDVAVNDVRTTLHLLLGDGLMAIEPAARQRSLTLRLSTDGSRMLAAIMRGWEVDVRNDAANVVEEEWNAP